MTASEIGRIVGFSQPTVLAAIRRAGVPIRSSQRDLGPPPKGLLWCLTCRKAKPRVAGFHKAPTKRGRTTKCRQCAAEYHLARTYGLTVKQLHDMMDTQEGRCPICTTELAAGKRGFAGSLHVDHCHDSGRVRGLLCGQCNAGLGNFKDDPEALRRAANYLEGRRG